MLERTRLLDDAERFERAWPALREGAAEIGVPELHAPGHRLVAELGERLEAAEGLDAGARLVVAEWRKIEAAQTALAEEVGTLPGRIAAWRERRADLPQDEPGGLDPKHPARRAWREEGGALESIARDMLRPEDVHAPHLAAMPGERKALVEATSSLESTLLAVKGTPPVKIAPPVSCIRHDFGDRRLAGGVVVGSWCDESLPQAIHTSPPLPATLQTYCT